MIGESTATCVLDSVTETLQESAGLHGQNDQNPIGRHAAGRRPLSMAWVSDDLLAETIAVWSDAYGRRIDENEAVEILMNVKRLGEVLSKARQEVSGP